MNRKNTVRANRKFMQEAIKQAILGKKDGDYGIGAVMVKEGKILATCNSRSKRDESPMAHAEVLAILKASEIFKKRHMPDCILYTTHEPCPMCSSLAVFSKLKGIIYGARIKDMKSYRLASSNSLYLWRTIDISCEEVIAKSSENMSIIKDFMRKECVKLFHNKS